MKRYLIEFIGTFFLVFTICLTGQPLGIGLIYAAMIYLGGHISGGHYNPAITVAIWLRGKINQFETCYYILAQCIGSFCAAACFNLLTQNTFFPAPLQHVQYWEAITIETLFTFVLCSVFLVLMTSVKLKNNTIYGLAIGLTLSAIIFAGGEISGGAFNPAVAVGPIIYDTIIGGGSLSYLVIYLTGPFLGGILSVFCYNYLN